MAKKNRAEENHLLMKCLTGSRAYGTSTPESDTDIRGIFCAPKKAIVTPWFPVREMVLPEEEDGKLYELTNFMKLFVDQNPNILELLFVDRGDVIETSPAYELLRENASSLLSSKVAFTFSGYAMSQMQRIKGHDKWINNPQPSTAPTQMEFLKLVHNYLGGKPVTNAVDLIVKLHNMSPYCVFIPFGENIFGIVEADKDQGLFNDDGSIRKLDYEQIPDELKRQKPLMIIKYLAQEHNLAKDNHKNYWSWKNNRNDKRHALEVAHGYDTKHGMHLVRLMRMGEELLTEGKLLVRRPDAEELLAIRNGAWSYEKMISWAEEKDEYIRGELYRKTDLPRTANIHKAAELLMEVQESYWKKEK